MIKDIIKQIEEEIHGSGRAPSAGPSVPMELRHIQYMDRFTNLA